MTVVPIRSSAPKVGMDTVVLTPETMDSWPLPVFQAPLKKNAKVLQISDQMREESGTPVIEGVITLGFLRGETTIYLLDGQHRRAAALLSGRSEFIADVRTKQYETMADMAREFLILNTPISRKTPDDQLRAMAEMSPVLQMIQEACPYIGYRYIRANPTAPVVSMSATLRRWRGSGYETPSVTGSYGGAVALATGLTEDDAKKIIVFMQTAYSAWGSDAENARLWASLNTTVTMWLWRVLVLDKDRSGARRYAVLTPEQFRLCILAASADSGYVEWLGGRNMSERDRAPCYSRLRSIFTSRIQSETGEKIRMPQPSWFTKA